MISQPSRLVVRPDTCSRAGCGRPVHQAVRGRPRRWCSSRCRDLAHDQAQREARRHAELEEAAREWRALQRARSTLSSASVEWYTPPALLAELADRYGPFDLDPAADERAPAWALVPHHYTAADDGLVREWFGCVWLNPPYGHAIPTWLAKVVDELAAGRVRRVVVLLPARPDTRWWAAALAAGAVPEFRRGRVKFLEPRGHGVAPRAGAPFPSAVLVFDAAAFRRPPEPTK